MFSTVAQRLFDLSSQKSYAWPSIHENVLQRLSEFLLTKAVLHAFSPEPKSTAITDASSIGIGAGSEQNGHPVLCISRRLSPVERGYYQVQ